MKPVQKQGAAQPFAAPLAGGAQKLDPALVDAGLFVRVIVDHADTEAREAARLAVNLGQP